MDQHLVIARTICGVSGADWDQLSSLYLDMMIEADRIASQLPATAPEKALAQYEDELDGRFPTSSVKIILAMALMQALAFTDMDFPTFANLGKSSPSKLN